jgi:serine protease Do
VAMAVMRRKDKLELQVTTQEMVEDDQNQPPVEGPQIGLALQALNPEIAKHYGLARTKGLLITQVEEGSPAADAGLASGDIIVEAGQRFVADLESFRQIVAKHPKGGTLLLLIDRGGTTTYATLALP